MTHLFEALQRHESDTRQKWLLRGATNGGIALVQEHEKHKATPVSPEEKQEPPALFFKTEGKWTSAMPHRLKRFLFLIVVGVAASVKGYYLAPFGFGTVAVALTITVILAVGWMRTYWKG